MSRIESHAIPSQFEFETPVVELTPPPRLLLLLQFATY
jgi:hypothetical protein